MNFGRYWLLLPIVLGLLGCASSTLSLPESTLETRARQTQEFAGVRETTLLTATIAVLQDMGYTIEESEKALGIVTAAKRARVGSTGELILASLAAGFAANGGVYTPVENQQLIRVTVVTRKKSSQSTDYQVRATFQREVWDTQGNRTRAETITSDTVYQDFFANLSKAVFLEQQ
jgi:hypothetical protein